MAIGAPTNPQIENGHTDIANEIMEALAKIRISGEARQVLDLILRKTYGWHKKWDRISLSQFTLGTGLKKSTVCKALNKLLFMNLVITKKDNAGISNYMFNKYYDTWKPLPKKKTLKDGSTITIENIKMEIRKRDINTCQICEHIGTEQETLSVHHIDYNQGNNDESNLITLCKTCHGRTNSNYDYWKEKLAILLTNKLITQKDNLPKKEISITQKGNKSLPKKGHTKETIQKKTITKENIVSDKSLLSLFNKIESDFTEEELKLKQEFFDYWKEKSEGGRKERWEMEKVFDINRRFRTWLNNKKKWEIKQGGKTKIGGLASLKEFMKKEEK